MEQLSERTIISAPTEPRTSPWFKVGESHVITKGGAKARFAQLDFRVVSPRRGLDTGMQLACFVNDQRIGEIKNFDLSHSREITHAHGDMLFELVEGDKVEYRMRKEYGKDIFLVLDNIRISLVELHISEEEDE